MGIYYRYAAAALILLFCADSYAVTRKTVNHGQSKASVINGGGASFQTPSGDAAYFGQDYVDEHTAGSRFTTNDNPTGSTRDDIKAKQKVPVKPTITVNPKKAAKAVVSGMRGGVPGIIASAAASAIIGAVDGVIEDGAVKVPTTLTIPPSSPGDYYWTRSGSPTQYPTAMATCEGIRSNNYPTSQTRNIRITGYIDTNRWGCRFEVYFPTSGNWMDTSNYVYRQGAACPAGSTFDTASGSCTATAFIDPSDSHWITMEDWASVRDSDFVRDMVRASCEGSISPSSCYEDMADWGNLQGPSSQTGPAQVTTTTKTNPDGTTSTTTTTTQNRYEYNFGPNYYNYSTTTKTTQNTDGVVTETETTDGSPEDTPTQEEDSSDYSFDDTDFPEVPSFYEQKYPDGLEGVWQQARADVDQSAFMQFLQGFVPSFSGSCPSFGLGFNIASWANYGTIQFSSICYVLDFVKIILLVTALFTFRKVTFGG